jgi:putative DNA primase/helicase
MSTSHNRKPFGRPELTVPLRDCEPDPDQLARFIRVLFKHASAGGIVSLRAFPPKRDEAPIFIRNFEIEADGFDSIIVGAVRAARDAAKAVGVFCPPVAVFKSHKNASERNLAEGVVLSVECDERPQWARQTLAAVLGPPTLVVASGGLWINPETGEIEEKLHLHWRLAVPARDAGSLTKLKKARALATAIVGADASGVPIVHPLRWPGSWHLKAEPRLCHIIEENDVEIDLGAAYELLLQAAPPEAVHAVHKVAVWRETRPRDTRWSLQTSADIETLAGAVAAIPNPDVKWDIWKTKAMQIYAATAGSDAGFEIWDAWSQKSRKKNIKEETRAAWLAMRTSPPDRTGAWMIFKEARRHGWRTTPTHAAAGYTGADEARREIARLIHNFLHPNVYQTFARKVLSSASAIKVETGIGKTEAAIKAIADCLAGNDATRVGYGVATHRLSSEIEQRFADQDVKAATYRGRMALDPDGDGENDLMCMLPGKVDAAVEARVDIERHCCRHGEKVCEFYHQCAFQRQKEKIKAADVVIFASDVIFHAQPAIGDLDMLFLDESFWDAQIGNEIEIPLGKLSCDADPELRHLATTLMAQPEDGPLLLRYAAYAGDMDALRARLLNEKPELEFHPGMSASAMKAYIRRNRKLVERAALFRNLADVVPDIDAMWSDDITISGRLFLATEDGKRLLRWRGVRKVTKQFDVPSFMMDATLPPLEILTLTHPRVRLAADIRVAMPPHVRIVQVLDAPVSKNKLIVGQHKQGHQQEIVGHIMRRWLECGRGKTLVVCQQEFKDKVLKRALPKEIALLHFNALSGVDKYKDVRLCVIVGRTLPKSGVLEALAATLTGVMPEWTITTEDDEDDDDTSLRYERVKRGIRLKNGEGIAVHVNQHPNTTCEALRWLACEGELMQALGRPRGINRTAATPLDIDLLFDEVLPIEVDAVESWERPVLYYATAREGVMLTAATDMMTIWPELFPNRSAADRVVAKGVPALPGFVPIHYQMKGRNQKFRLAHFDMSLIGDPLGWLTERLGPVTLRAKS